MSSELNILLTGQRDIHDRISRAVDNLKKMGSANITLSAVETRLALLDQLWLKFENQHELIRADLQEKFEGSEYVKSNFFDLVENLYVQQKSILTEYANRFKPAAVTQDQLVERSSKSASKTALPRIQLPKFFGLYENWPSFRDLFLSVIGKNTTISNIERYHYLRSCLQGSAERLINSLTVTEENYERAWAILEKQYENKRELIRSNFATFTAVAKMKGDTADELSRIYNAITSALNAQESIGRPIESHGMDLFNFLIVELFDSRTRLEWESSICDSTDPPKHDTLINFIARRIHTLNAARPKGSAKTSNESTRTAKSHFTKHKPEIPRCALCKESHSLRQCSEFKAKPASDRKNFVEKTNLCYNCLGTHQIAKCQSAKTCFTCHSRHHTLLHDAYVSPKPTEVNSLSASQLINNRKTTLLATARVIINDCYGNPQTVRALIDQGSEISLASEALVQRLRIPRSSSKMSVVGIGGTQSNATRGKVNLKVKSRVSEASFSTVAFILPRLSLYDGASTENRTTWPHIKGLPLADPQFHATDPIELLLGAEVCSIILEDGLRKGGPQTPMAQKTSLGWILSGGCNATSPFGLRKSLQCTADHDLVDLVRRFWEQEAESFAPVSLTPEEKKSEDFFSRTHSRNSDGRYVVRLPLRSAPTNLAGTRGPAERLLIAMERKSSLDSRFGKLYRDFMREYEELQHMERVSAPPVHNPCYLPHHGVFRESSSTTKLRVVFNGSQTTTSGESLNKHLLIGANLLPSLTDVILRWRQHRYVIITDIEKMYRQIVVHSEDRDLQRILWRHNATDRIQEFRLTTVTYGLACAPFLAIRTLHQLATDEQARYPLGARALRQDCYVDDIVTGANSLSEAITIQRELRRLYMAGGFPLRKWASNCDAILREIPLEHQLHNELHAWKSQFQGHSTLGLRWHPTDDSFAFKIHGCRKITAYTKRIALAETARLFDPLGWLAPVTIRAKILIQSAWLQGLDWDAPLPQHDARKWQSFFSELPLLEQLRIKRWFNTDNEKTRAEIHGFADASERGYAAVVYLRVSLHNQISTHLLSAKSKVA